MTSGSLGHQQTPACPGECTKLPKGYSTHTLTWEQLGGARAEKEAPYRGGCAAPGAGWRDSSGGSTERRLRGQEQLREARVVALRRGSCMAGSANPTEQCRPRRTGHWDTAQDPASPGTCTGREDPGQQGRSCPELSRSVALPQSLQALQTESSRFTEGAEFRFPELATATGVVLPGASRGKKLPLSPAPGRGQSSSPKC